MTYNDVYRPSGVCLRCFVERRVTIAGGRVDLAVHGGPVDGWKLIFDLFWLWVVCR